jgi:hypothetical protein
MAREPRFPDDWIAPGEFSWCAGCGGLLVAAGGACPACRARRTGGAFSRDEMAAARAEHARLKARRDALAGERRAAGTPALFWVTEGGCG